MSQKVYADEATLTAQLDKLLSTATTPTQASSLYTDTEIAPNKLVGGHVLANEHLSTIAYSPLPVLPPSDITKGCEELLASAFTAIIRLTQSAQANKNLRESAEASLRLSSRRADELSKRLEGANEKVKKRDVTISAMRNVENDIVSKHRMELRKSSAECNQLRTRLVHAGHRENHLLLAAKKKEKEFGQLQARVHALFKSSATIDARITRAGNRISPKSKQSLDADINEIGEDRTVAVEGENDFMRGLLQAVQEELDDLILSHGHTDAGSEVSEEFDVSPAPSDEVMALPLDVIGEELQDNLEKKFGLLRKALERRGAVHAYEHVVDGGEDDAEDDAEDDSENELVDAFNEEVEGEEQSGEQDTELADSQNQREEASSDKVGSNQRYVQSPRAELEQVAGSDEEVDQIKTDVRTHAESVETELAQVVVNAEHVEAVEGQAEKDAQGFENVEEDVEPVKADGEQIQTSKESVSVDVEAMKAVSKIADIDAGPAKEETAFVDTSNVEETTEKCEKVAVKSGSFEESREEGNTSSEPLEQALKTLSINEVKNDSKAVESLQD